MAKDKAMILSATFAQEYANDSIPAKINAAIPDASAIVSVVHERDELGHLIVTVYYRSLGRDAMSDKETPTVPFKFWQVHPDPIIAREVVIDCLLGVISEARAAILRGLDYSAVTPNGISIKNALRNAIETTSGEAIESRLYRER